MNPHRFLPGPAAIGWLAQGPGPMPRTQGIMTGPALLAETSESRPNPPRGRFTVNVHDIAVKTLSGQDASLGDLAGTTLLVVNVASQCGLTPQYEGLQRLHDQYSQRGFSVVGFPCNQFGAQEPGTAEEIGGFCSVNYGVTFPMFEKIEVNGPGRHPVYTELTAVPDAEGQAGDVQWNFEKFLVGPDGTVIARFRPLMEPEDPAIVSAIEASLPG
jgi:glutathione peroxidase